ncbi:glycosyltransferase [Vibrio minamisatsumaniensis]|uniref:glycosyltransferase n=1 Tax=Vibrio minamisatsumaniensis TaxID=2910243 RepID=UPI003D2494AE
MGRLKQKLYIDCTSTNRINITSGIQRVVRQLLDGMPYISVQLDLEVVPISGQFGDYYLQKDAEEMSVDNFEQYDPVEFNYNDIYFCPDAFWSCEIYKWYEYFNSKGLIIVTTIYDLIPLDEREFTSKNERELFKVALDSIIQYSDMLLTPTLATKQELVSYLIENEPDINHPRVEVSKIAPIFWNDSITNNVPNVESIGEKKNDFLLMVGTLEKRRGYLETIESLVNYWDNGGKLQLKIVGKVADDTIALKISEFSNSGYPVENMTSVNDVELLSLYENSKAIICSSLSEGYGLSVAEGLLLNGKVIANKIPVFGEFAGSMPYYFDINNPKQLVELVKNVDSLKPVETPTFVEWDECYDELIRHLVSVSPLHEKNINLSPGLLNKAFVYQSFVALGLDEPDSDVLKYWLANYSDPHEFLSALYYESTQKTTDLAIYYIYHALGLHEPDDEEREFWKKRYPEVSDFVNELKEIK